MTTPDQETPPAAFSVEAGAVACNPLPSPEPRVMARAADAKRRNATRAQRLATKFDEGQVRKIGPRHADVAAHTEIGLDAFGTTSTDFITAEMLSLLDALRPRDKPTPSETDFNAALAVIDGSRPDDELAALLAIQMAATHSLAMSFLGRTRRADNLETLHAYGAMATRLLRTFTMQTEAIAKLKRGGAQTVRVEHVHVHNGAQAIVGNIGAGAGGRGEIAAQPFGSPDAGAVVAQERAALLGQDAEREAMPAPRGNGPEALPTSRRRGRKRSAEG